MVVRLKDIAAELGVSTITVSKVLRNKPDIGAETRKRVLEKVQALNYRPNMMARGLASGKSYTVGLIVPDLVDSFFAELAKSVGAALRLHSYQLLLASADQDRSLEALEIANLTARGVDALLLASCQETGKDLPEGLQAAVPFVLVDRKVSDLQAHFVGTDDVRAGRIATEHLAALGHKRIAHIGGNRGLSTSADRRKGYQQALAAAGLPLRENLVLAYPLHEDRGDHIGRKAMDSLLSLPEPPDAVFCYSDLIAVGAIRSVRAHGLRVPEDVAIIGCGNLALSSYLEVPLSSVDQGIAQLGEQAAKLALALVEGKHKRTFKHSLVEPTVVARASTIAGRST